MSKKKTLRQHSIQKRFTQQPTKPAKAAPRQPTTEDLRQEGLRAFRAGRYVDAINLWEKIWPEAQDGALAAALAEAHFRQAVIPGIGANSLPPLERATCLAPADAKYAYYRGVALHKVGQVAEAMEAYRRAIANGLSRREAGMVIALAALELDPHADLSAVAGVSPQDRQALAPLADFLQGKPQAEPPKSLLGGIAERLNIARPSSWRAVFDGVLAMAAGKTAEARQALMNIEGKQLPRSANAVRWYYIGVGAARAGDKVMAIEAWKQVQRLASNLSPATHRSLVNNLVAIYARQSAEKSAAGNWSQAAQDALEGLGLLPGDTTLSNLAITALDQSARAAAGAGDWGAAGRAWAQARQVLSGMPGGSTPRPIVHNLALAYEAVEQWEDAAEAWRAMLRTKPRKKTAEGFSDAHWTWVRKRVIECYKRAGRPDEAITIFRQALKANPDDADMQLDLAEALLANEQEQSAVNELEKLLDKHPDHVGALSRLAEVYGSWNDWHAAAQTMRRALEVEPENEDLRRRTAHVLAECGHAYNEQSQYAQARAMYENALKYAPDDYNLYFNLARAEFNGRQTEAARRYLERALEMGKDQADAYAQAFICWVVERKLDEARKILARGEASGKLSPEFYVKTGVECLERSAPPPDMPNPLSMILNKPKPKPPKQKQIVHNELHVMGQELLERAIALGTEADVLRRILGELGPMQPELCLPYAQRLARCTPEDPQTWLLLGLMYGLNSQVKEAQDALRQGERLARKQGDYALARHIKETIRAVADPFFATMFKMAPLLDELGLD